MLFHTVRNAAIVAGVTAFGFASFTAVSSASNAFDSACANNATGGLRVLLNGGDCGPQEQVVGLGAPSAPAGARVEYPEVTVQGQAGMYGSQQGFVACPAGTKPVNAAALPGGTAGYNPSSFLPDPVRNGVSFTWFHDYYLTASSLTVRGVCVG